MRNFRSLKIYVAGEGDSEGLILEADTLDTPKGKVSIYAANAHSNGEDKGAPVGTFYLADLMDALSAVDKAAFYDDAARAKEP